ncbi:MAG: type VI secretion system-associated FHA domain protein TagH [Granulosicoccus sp.]
MRLTLSVRSYCDQAPAEPHSRSFDAFPIIIGRSNSCNYILTDASRYISSNHAVVTLVGDRLSIQDTSANGVYINGASEPIGRGQSAYINAGDSLAIGDYTLSVSVTQPASSGSNQVTDDPFAQFGDGAPAALSSETPPAGSPAAGTPGGGAPSSPADFDPFRGDEPDWTPPSQVSDPFGEDWDVNETPAGASPSAGNSPAAGVVDTWADWDASHPPASSENSSPAVQNPQQSADDDFDWLPGSHSDSASSPGSRSSSGQDAKQASPQRRPGSPPAQGNIPAAGSLPTQASRAPAHSSPGQQQGRSLEILLRAATLKEADFSRYSEAQVLEQTGKVLAMSIDAMMVLLQSRAEIKNAIKSDVTSLSRSGNNPLKFSYSAADALTKLLSDDEPGYMSADSAIQEAVEDLKMHQLAMLDGMKAAVKSMLLEFDPDKLAKNLEKSGGISANIPITREAKLWEMFCEQYDAIRDEAVNDFGELFGKEFRKAYEKRMRQLGRSPEF